MSSLWKAFTGKELHQKVDEYSRTYGEVLVYMDRRLATLEAEVHGLKRRGLRNWVIAGLIVNAAGLAVIIWMLK